MRSFPLRSEGVIGLGWALAVVALVMGVMIVVDAITVTAHVIGFLVILLSGAILL